nr:MAG TPA: hypothetical protein [Caudoviricetes sp.]
MKYSFLNVNPLNKITSDCVCRAISLALNEDYYVIEKKLKLIAELFECKELCVCCYKHLLDDVYKLKRIKIHKEMTVKEFLNRHKKGIYIMRLEGHLTCGIDGRLLDIWNCEDKIVDLAWKVD